MLLPIWSLRRQDDAAPLIFSLHWLRIKERIKFKILLNVYKCLNGIGPAYLTELLTDPLQTEQSYCLRSHESGNLDIPHALNKYGDRSSIVCGPTLWNTLPKKIRTALLLTRSRSHLRPLYSSSL